MHQKSERQHTEVQREARRPRAALAVGHLPLALLAFAVIVAALWLISRPPLIPQEAKAPGKTATAPAGPPGPANALASAPQPAATATPTAQALPSDPQVAETEGETKPPAPLAPVTYIVQDGDTLSGIADAYGVTEDAIVWANAELEDRDSLAVGQELIIPPVTGILHTVEEGDTLLAIAALYEAETEEIVRANHLAEPFMLALGQQLVVPGGRPPDPPPAPEPEVEEQPLMVASLGRAEVSTRGERPDETEAVSSVVPHPLVDAFRASFLEKVIGPAQASQRDTGVPASVTIAQAIWESDWGRSGLATRANNYFGIKARPNPGPAGTIWLETWEHVNGRDITVVEPFKVYNSLWESFMDHGVYLRDSPRYALAMQHTDDPRLFIRLVHEAGYATDPAYTDKIINLLDRYDLYIYDLP